MHDAFKFALESLSRREHSAFELEQKLQKKGFEEGDIQEALEECRRLGYQCDKRYVDAYCQMRVQNGDGPMKIRHFLANKGIEDELIQVRLEEEDWLEHARTLKEKKFGSTDEEATLDYKEKARQFRFLQNRGFSASTIQTLMKDSF